MIAALALALFFVALACWFGYQLVRQNGRILDRLEALERAFENLALLSSGAGANSLAKSRLKRDGLTQGVSAPDFSVPRLGGGELSLAEFRGRQVLLVFSDPQCGPCDVLAARLGRCTRAEHVQIIMVSRGDPEANRAKVVGHRLTFPVGLQRHWEISLLYAMFATPIAYLIDQEGIVAAPVAKGADAILALLSQAASTRGGPSAVEATSHPVSVGAEG